jgi:hypothetical protein
MEIALERERDVARDQQQVARRDVDEVLVQVRDADAVPTRTVDLPVAATKSTETTDATASVTRG